MQRNWRLTTKAAFAAGERGGGGAMPAGRVAARAKKKLLGGSSAWKNSSAARVRERASLSFFLVLLFFGVFGLIVLTEILFIDGEAGSGPGGRRAVGVPGSRGRGNWGRRRGGAGLGLDAPDYEVEGGEEEGIMGPAAEDYFIYRGFRAGVPMDTGVKAARLAPSRSKFPRDLGESGKKKYGFRVFPRGGDVEDAEGGGGQTGPGSASAAGAIAAEEELNLAGEENLPPVKDAEWQPVKGTRFKFYVYSAYYDSRGGERMVRIIGATRTRSPERVWCRLWLSSATNFTSPTASVNSSSNSSEAKETRFVATVLARVKVIRENWNLKYSACFVICPLRAVLSAAMSGSTSAPSSGHPSQESPRKPVYSKMRGKMVTQAPLGPPPWPLWVSVVSRSRKSAPAHRLQVRNTEAHQVAEAKGDPRFGDRWGVCIKPLHFSYNQPLHMVEFIEFHSILGFDHFTMYNHTVGPAVSCILNLYANKGVVTLLPWSLDMVSQREIRTEGLFAALNDCLYRSMHRYRYLALIDLDEFIVPRKFQQPKDHHSLGTSKPPSAVFLQNDTDSSLFDLLSSLSTRAPAAGAFSFQNAFFYLQWADDEEISQASKTTTAPSSLASEVLTTLVTQRKTRRRARAHPHKQRSKYICRPERVVEAGNHFVWEFTSGSGGVGVGGGSVGAVHVPSDAALLHHYRVCEFGGDDCIRTAASVVDRTAHRFRESLVRRVAARWAEAKEVCSLPPLHPEQKGATPHR